MGPMDISSNCLWSGSDRILGVKTTHFDLVQPRCGLRQAVGTSTRSSTLALRAESEALAKRGLGLLPGPPGATSQK